MSNTVVTTIKVAGEGRYEIKDLFERSSVGHAWNLKEYGTVLLCDVKHGDGITVEDDAIVIRGESKNSPPLLLVEKLSADYPGLTFEVKGKDLLNLFLQRWRFQAGEGRLLDCVQGAYEGEGEEIVYMLDGEQFLKLPEWVAVDDLADDRQDIPESPFPFGRSDEIHGELGAPCSDYVPTKHELDLLARHWAGVKVEIEDFWQIHEQVGSSDMRQNAYANLRLNRIAKHLGDARIPPVAKADDHDTSEDHHLPDVTNTYEAIDRIDELVLAALRSGRDEYSILKLSALTLMKPIESAQIAEILPEPSDQAAAIRWVMRGLSVEHAVAKVRLDHEMVEAIRDKRRSEKELQQSLDMSSEEIEEMKMYLKGK